MPSVPRAVLDPNVLVSARISPLGATARLLTKLEEAAFQLLISPALLAELADVLQRDKFRRYITEEDAEGFVDFIRRHGQLFPDPRAIQRSPEWGLR